MSKVIVGRPINGITINEELEFLLNDDDTMLYFDDVGCAKQYLADKGISEEEMEHMKFIESCGRCRRCGAPLFYSFVPDYKYQCFDCDEDFYGFEQGG